MTVDEIRQKITATTGAKTAARLYQDGLAVGVQLRPGQSLAVWAMVPIDDESRERFVEFLIASWHKDGGTVTQATNPVSPVTEDAAHGTTMD